MTHDPNPHASGPLPSSGYRRPLGRRTVGAVLAAGALVLAIAGPASAAAKPVAAGAAISPAGASPTSIARPISSRTTRPAAITDPNLVNAWGISHGPDTPIWISDNGRGVTTLYQRAAGGTPVSRSGPPSLAAP